VRHNVANCLPFVGISLCLCAAAPDKFRFELCSIRLEPRGQQPSPGLTPGGYRATLTLREAVLMAYGPVSTLMWNTVNLLNAPNWFYADRYNIDARVAQADLRAWQSQGGERELLRLALRTELKERFKLVIREQPSKEKMFELVVRKGGPKLKAAARGSTPPAVSVKLANGGFMTPIGSGTDGWTFYGATMLDLAQYLTMSTVVIPVRDRTGLTGSYDFPVRRIATPDEEEQVYGHVIGPLGLELKPGTEIRSALVVDHVERPTPN